eukprot:augustus_masked-scaffold_2-processed-gene-17.41-mRNA-1 protein AED:0.02 eAED:0.03 QI:0/-1/0/1/-1/1/1/0/337
MAEKHQIQAQPKVEVKISSAKVEKAQTSILETVKKLSVGGAAGVIARTTVAPIDRVKILMQTSHLLGKAEAAQHTSITKSFLNIVKTEGIGSLWRGNLTNCVRVIPHTATQFYAFDAYKELIVSSVKSYNATRDNDITLHPIVMRLLSGGLSGMTAATVTHPLDVVRIRLQTQKGVNTVRDAVAHVFKENGLRTFYKGYIPAMLSLSPFIAINFATMDTLKKMYFGDEDKNLSKKELQSRNPFATLTLGAISGIIAQSCCYPLDTVRRRMQLAGTNYTSTRNAFSTILRVEGLRGFYKGMSANALKVVPNNAIRFASFDILKTFIMSDNKEKEKFAK